MRGSHAKTMPSVLVDWLALENPDWRPSYRTMPQPVRQSVVDALYESQRGLCVYCGRRLDMSQPGKSYHIEHFRPQSAYPNRSARLANLFLSCGQETDEGNLSETCGTAKGDWFDEENCIEPDYPDCTNRFRFLLTGEVAPESENDAAAFEMIGILNLNHRELKKDREDILDRIDGGSLDLSDFIEPESGTAQAYAHVVYRRHGIAIP